MKIKIDWQSLKGKGVKEEPHQFPIGTRAYHAFQGRGKTISATHYIIELQKEFPNCVIFSNVKIKGLRNFYFCEKDDDIYFGLSFENGKNGVICFIDEAHLFFNKKTGVPMDVLQQISQQRKERRKIVITSQIWEDLPVEMRKQVPEIVKCWNYGNIQINQISNGETLHYDKRESQYVAKTIGYEIFKRTTDLAERYDTRQKILTNAEYRRDLNPSFNVLVNQVTNEKKRV